jgi:UDP-4-amino-4,6-dideoxy-N-acetyl-beta-L-altrosamine transaminase
MIPYARQDISQADIDAVVEVLKSDWLTQGPAVGAFEQAVADYVGVPYAVACNSATSGLHIACLALGLGPGDLLWTSPNTFVASANCGLYCGATVDFVDIDPRTYNMSVDALAAKLEQAQRAGRLPKVVIPVHFSGEPCDMARIHALAQSYGFRVIEDASHAIGARYGARRVGACEHSDITVFSFHPVKIITTGEGGLATTRDPELAKRLARFRSHGIIREAAITEEQGAWFYQQVDLGYNYRMPDILAVLGSAQLRRIDGFVARRNALADRYDELLQGLPLQLPTRNPQNLSAMHLYVVKVMHPHKGRRQIFEALRANGIGVNVHYIPVHTQPFYQSLGFKPGAFPEAEGYYQGAISIPMYYSLSDADQDRVVEQLRSVLA